jgi:hypothetical protein
MAKESNDYLLGQQDLIKYLNYESALIIGKAESSGKIDTCLDIVSLIKSLKPINK